MKRGGRLFQFLELWAFHQELHPRDVSFSFTSSSTLGKPFFRFSWRLELGVRGKTERKNFVFFKHFMFHKYTLYDTNFVNGGWWMGGFFQLVINILLAEYWKYQILLNFPLCFAFQFSSIESDSRRKDWLMFLRIFNKRVSYFIGTNVEVNIKL